MKPKQIFRFKRPSFTVVSFLVVAVALLVHALHTTPVFATCATRDGNADCVSQNCADAIAASGGTLNVASCQNAVNACENTNDVSGRFTTGTSQGNCSNALRSCFMNEVNQQACTDKDTLALATGCANGNVNADGSCGMDWAIDEHNKLDGGADFSSNKGTKGDRVTQQLKECDNQQNYPTTKARNDCQNQIRDQIDSCYSQNGGTAGRITDQQYQDCIAKQSSTEQQCTARGGTWAPKPGGNGGTCTPAVHTDNNATCSDGSAPNSSTGKCADGSDPQSSKAGQPGNKESFSNCGKAETNLISCDAGSDNCGGSSSSTQGTKVIGCVLKFGIQALTLMVGIGAVGGIAWEAMQYARAQDDSSIVSNARNRIRDIVIGLIVYGFMLAIIGWLIPGSVIGG